MSRVFVADELALGRKVVIKVIAPDLVEGLSAERFAREVKVAARLQQANIVPVLTAGEVDGIPWYAMPYVAGESLRARLASGARIPLPEALSIVRDVARALAAAHAAGVVHRDIKPENILLSGGAAMVTDFGIAKALAASQRSGAATGHVTAALTRLGHAIGTAAYMAPEQAAGDPDTDQRADLYAWGVVAWEVFVGTHPFADRTTPHALLAAHMTTTPPELATRRPDTPVALNQIVRDALEKDPARRPDSANAVLAALDQVTTSGRSYASASATRRIWWLGAVGAVLIVLVAAVLIARHERAAALPRTIHSIAVLPLDNFSADSSQNYFAEGMTDELTTDLASIGQLRVTSRGSAMQFQGRNRPATPAIAKTLGVDALVEGSVTRAGDKVRITVQLIDARADSSLWAHSFNGTSSDVLTLQAELASAIAREIKVQLTPSEQSRLAAAPTVNPQAYDAYLKGRYFFNRPSDANLEKAIAQFEEAVRLSPTFAPAYSGLSDAYLWAGYNEGFITAAAARPKAQDAAERAVQLDDKSAEAHTSLATFDLFYEYNWSDAEKEFRRAIALNPNYAFAHDQLGLLLGFVGRYDESIAQGNLAITLDPLSPQVLIDATMAPMFKRDFGAARDLAQRAGELDPTFFFPVMMQGWIALDAGKYRDAIPSLVKAQGMDAPPFVTAYLAFARGAAGDTPGAMADLDSLQKMAGTAKILPFNRALVYIGLGDRARAIDCLEQALEADSQMLGWLGHDSIFDSLRSEPRFIALLKRLKFIA